MVTKPNEYAATVTKHPRIHDVKTKALRLIPDERGWLMEMLRADEPELFCVAGMVKLVLVDTRPESPTNGAVNEFFIGVQNPTLVQVPNLVYHGWKCISTEVALVVNTPTEPYHYGQPDEFRLEPHGTLPYDWSRKDG